MTDDPVNDDFEEIRRLKSLAPLFRKGWAKLHPMPEKDSALIDQAFSQLEHGKKAKAIRAKTKKSTKVQVLRKSTKKKPDQSQSETQGPSHSH